MTLYGDLGQCLSFRADVDMNNYQYKFVCAASTAGYVKLATGASNPFPIGVIQNDPRPGEEAVVMITGVSKVAASAPVAYGSWISCGSASARGEYAGGSSIQGMALEALASGSGYIRVLLMPMLAGAVIPAS